MMSGGWNNLQMARLNAEQEANNLMNIFRFGYQLPPERDPKCRPWPVNIASP